MVEEENKRKVLVFRPADGWLESAECHAALLLTSLLRRRAALANVYLLRIHGKEEHDGEAR